MATSDGLWIHAVGVDWNTDAGEDEVRWLDYDAAIARVSELNHM